MYTIYVTKIVYLNKTAGDCLRYNFPFFQACLFTLHNTGSQN